MKEIILTLALISLAVWIWHQWLRIPEVQPLRERRVSTRIEIYCQDCDLARAAQRAGNRQATSKDYSRIPNKTFLTVERRCDGCGGRAYVLAARFGQRWADAINNERAALKPELVEEVIKSL